MTIARETAPAIAALGDLLEIDGVRSRVDRALADFLAARFDAAPADESRGLLTPVVSLLGGGKRLRAALCYWGWRGAGRPDGEAAIIAATALEVLHGCALIHDDVMDAAATRRGRPAVHRGFAAEHAAARWRGGSEQFGTAAAILAGDLCLVWADELLRASGLSAASLHRAGPVYDSMRTDAIRGQYLDLLGQAQGTPGVEYAWRAARGKTAASTTTGPLAFGAALAGAGLDLAAAYRAYAEPLGIAFQLRDDLLGAFGDPDVTGKPVGDDLREGKCTVLLARAIELGSVSVANRIRALLRRQSDEPEIATDASVELRELIEQSGARASVVDLIAELGRAALAALETTAIEPAARRVLAGLATAITVDITCGCD